MVPAGSSSSGARVVSINTRSTVDHDAIAGIQFAFTSVGGWRREDVLQLRREILSL